MKIDCQNILQWTEAQLKFTYDVNLKDASAEELHDALGRSVMMAISDNWSHSKKVREFYGLASCHQVATCCTPPCNTCVAPDVRAVLI